MVRSACGYSIGLWISVRNVSRSDANRRVCGHPATAGPATRLRQPEVIYDRCVPENNGAASPVSLQESSASQQEERADAGPRLRGVITDWGGVMTNPIAEAMNAWLDADGIDRASFAAVIRPWLKQAYGEVGDTSPVHALERGECEHEEFERLLADRLVRFDGQPVVASGLLNRMFAGSIMESAMRELMSALRKAGVRTALLSNSWGGTGYPRDLFPEMFDVVVISSEVGMRKPEEEIFRHAAALLGLEPEECVFIDDIEANVLAAEAVGLVGVHHHEASRTAERLGELLGIQLA
jgi:putative hydrolase of the HAD superfamily